MIVSTEQYYVQNTNQAKQARILLNKEIRDKLGLRNKVINIVILEEGERVTAEELNEKLDKLEEVNALYKKMMEMKEELR